MAKRYSGNASSMGTASHIEKIYPPYSASKASSSSNRRSRSKCIYYSKEDRLCANLGIHCVGPSNPLCKKYTDKTARKAAQTAGQIKIGTQVNIPPHGAGRVRHMMGNTCEVYFFKTEDIQKFSKTDLKKFIVKDKKAP